MLKRLRTIAWIAAFACLVFGFFFAVLQSSQHHHQDHQTAQASENKIGNTTPAVEDPNDRIARYTLWLMVFTGVLAISTIGLWIVTWRVGNSQSKETKILQRAYIAVDGSGISPLAENTSVAHINVRNVGSLPATQVKWFIETAISEDGRRAKFPINETKFYGNNTMPPGTNMLRSQNFSIADQTIEKIIRGGQLVYVWGEIRYFDGFGKQRFTRFCHRYDRRGHKRTEKNVSGGRPVLPFYVSELTAESMRYHQYGNDAD